MSKEDFKIEFLRSFFRLAVLILLTVSIVRDERRSHSRRDTGQLGFRRSFP